MITTVLQECCTAAQHLRGCYSLGLGTLHLEEMGEASDHVETTAGDSCLGQRPPVLVQENEARHVLDVIVEKLHSPTQ